MKLNQELSGIIVHFDENEHSNLISQRITNDNLSFSDTLSAPDWKFGNITIALLSFSENDLNYIAICKKGRKVATLKNRVEYSNLINLNNLPISTIEEQLDNRIRHYFIRTSRGKGGLIPPATWDHILKIIKNERPLLSDSISRLFSLLNYSSFRVTGTHADILLQEREAIGISLDIFSGSNHLREQVLREWAPTEESIDQVNEEEKTVSIDLKSISSSFLSGINIRHLQEESAIQHDLYNWNGMTPSHIAGSSIFQIGNRKLEIIYTNRNTLEKTLGVDLIYYNEKFKSFVLVQYKIMSIINNIPIYRPDDQMYEELERMNKFYNDYKDTTDIDDHYQYRLNDDGFFFKLVPQKGIGLVSGQLIKGMYIPREYIVFLTGKNGPKGSRGGPKITFENSRRYLTNTDFAKNVHDGRIGTRGTTSVDLSNLIRSYYETGRALILSYESTDLTEQSYIITENTGTDFEEFDVE